jgi:hypothetical protein
MRDSMERLYLRFRARNFAIGANWFANHQQKMTSAGNKLLLAGCSAFAAWCISWDKWSKLTGKGWWFLWLWPK